MTRYQSPQHIHPELTLVKLAFNLNLMQYKAVLLQQPINHRIYSYLNVIL